MIILGAEVDPTYFDFSRPPKERTYNFDNNKHYPELNDEIQQVLLENPVESIFDLEEDPIIIERWISGNGLVYIEFDTEL